MITDQESMDAWTKKALEKMPVVLIPESPYITGVDWSHECKLATSEAQRMHSRRNTFLCRDCKKTACFYCGDLINSLCEDCKEDYLD